MAKAPPAPPSRPSRLAPAVAVAAVVLLVAGLVWFQTREEPAGTAAPTPGDCVAPPSPPDEPRQFDTAPAPERAQDATWRATVTTSCGDIELELDGAAAPQAVASFLFLAEEGYWDDSPCHRLTTSGIFVLQCGDPTGTGSGGPGYGYGVENAPPDGTYPRGTLAMARTADPNSNGGQFFVVYRDSRIPDPTGYSIFGEVVEGLEIVDLIAEQGLADDGVAPAAPISILDITLDRA